MNGRKLEEFLGRRTGGRGGSMGVDDLQGLLLQISFAIMIVFMMAYFLFRSDARKRQEEQLLEIERQKLVIAAEATDAEMRERYGLTVIDDLAQYGSVPVFTKDDALTDDPDVRSAFLKAIRNGGGDLSDPLELRRRWIGRVCEVARLDEADLSKQASDWLSQEADGALSRYGESVRRAGYRAAAELQRYWIANPSLLGDAKVADILSQLDGAGEERRLLLVTELSAALKSRALERLSSLAGAEILR